MSAIDWRERLLDQMPPDLAEEIDIFEGQMELRRQGKIEDRVFAETRLRRGVYGQRYDNGNRHDGIAQRQLVYPAGELTKGPETLWDAPGMVRIKVPYGGITPDQLEVIAELAEEYSDSILHITTRQDVQLHYVHIDDTADLMRRLAAVDITTREACGNGVRNLTACPLAGVCHTEAFDTTAYAAALFRFLLGHPDCQDFGRKFKPAFSGCAGEALRAGDDARLRRDRPRARWSTGSSAGPSTSTSAAASAPRRTRPSCSTRTTRSRSCCRPCRRSPACSAAWARRPTATARASSSWWRSSASTSSAGWWTRSARSSRTTSAGPRTCPRSRTTPSRRSRSRSRVRPPGRRPPRATRTGCGPTSTASASRASPSPPSPSRWAT